MILTIIGLCILFWVVIIAICNPKETAVFLFSLVLFFGVPIGLLFGLLHLVKS